MPQAANWPPSSGARSFTWAPRVEELKAAAGAVDSAYAAPDLDDAAHEAPLVAGGRVVGAADHVEEAAADEAHGEGAPAVVDDPPGAGLPRVLLHTTLQHQL